MIHECIHAIHTCPECPAIEDHSTVIEQSYIQLKQSVGRKRGQFSCAIPIQLYIYSVAIL